MDKSQPTPQPAGFLNYCKGGTLSETGRTVGHNGGCILHVSISYASVSRRILEEMELQLFESPELLPMDAICALR
jgi:hypothetical protein